MALIEINTEPTPKEIRVFGLLWLVFFAAVAGVAAWRPEALIGAAMFLGAAWLVSLALNGEHRGRQLLGIAIPALFGLTGYSVTSGVAFATVAGVLGAIGAVGALAVWIAPTFGKRLYVGWMTASTPIGWTISHLILGAVYYLVVTPIGLALRLVGYDPMHRGFDREAKSYWIERKPATEKSRYFKQF